MSQPIDVTPLSKPVNACRWNAAQIRATAQSGHLKPEDVTSLNHTAAWLEELGKVVTFAHQNPVLLLAIGNLALSHKDREAFLAALQGIDKATAEAEKGKTTNGQVWAPVE